MKKFEMPQVEVAVFEMSDVITTSLFVDAPEDTTPKY